MSRLALTRRPTALAVAAAATLLIAAPGALAENRGRGPIEVRPGDDAIAKAIARADSGDTIRVHAGRYREALVITKRVKIIAAKGDDPVIDGRCRTGIVIAVRTGGVLLRGLTVIGADEGFGSVPIGVDFNGVGRGSARDLTVKNTCGEEVEYGINVFGSERINIVGNRTRGFEDAGIYVGGITSTGNGALSIRDNNTFNNNRGIIVEDSAGGKIVVESNRIHDNDLAGLGPPTGIFLHNSDGVRIFDNDVSENGEIGIHLDGESDANVLTSNRVSGNPTNLLNEGSDNCGNGNTFGGAGNILPRC